MSKKLSLVLGSVGTLLALGLILALMAVPSAAQDAAITVSMSASQTGNEVTYTIVVSNSASYEVGDIYVSGSIPAGATFMEATSPAGSFNVGHVGGVADWLVERISAGGSLTFTYKVNKGTASDLSANAFVRWLAPSEGTASSASVTPTLVTPRRGCLACHVLVDPSSGRYTLAFEAHERAEVRGGQHPTVAPDGTSLDPTNVTGPEPCLQCHAPGTGARAGKGNVAPLALRDIVHPAHMFSTAFKEHYGGNCFTCHNVAGDGTFELLGQKVDVNEKGVPNPNWLPIPGALRPSEE